MTEMAKINNNDEEASPDALNSSRWRNSFAFIRSTGERLQALRRRVSLGFKKINEKWPVFGRISSALFSLTGELTAIVLGAAFFWLCAINIILSRQSVDLSFFQTDAEIWFENAFEGHHAEVGAMQLDWNAVKNTFTFRANDVVVYDAAENAVETVENITTELAFMDVIRGRFDPFRMDVSGGEVTLLRREDGAMTIGLGTPKTVGRLGPSWQSAPNEKPATDGNRASLWQDSHIEAVLIHDVTFHVVDKANDAAWTFVGTDIELSRNAERLTFAGQSYLQENGVASPAAQQNLKRAFIKANGSLSADLRDVESRIVLENFNPAKILPEGENFKHYARIDAPLSLDVQLEAQRGSGLQKLDIQAQAQAGKITLTDMATPLNAAQLKAAYAPEEEKLIISEVFFESDKVKLTGTAALGNIGNPARGFFKEISAFDIGLDRAQLDLTPQFEAPLDIKSIILSGTHDTSKRLTDFSEIFADFGAFQPNFTGEVTHSSEGALTGIKLNGPIDGKVSPQDMLSVWPVPLADGARQWVKRSALGGYLENINLEMNITEEMLGSLPPLHPNGVKATFDYKDGTIRYIETMTPATNLYGSGIMNGNGGDFSLESGNVGKVKLTSGTIDIPTFYPKGGDLNIDVDGVGPLSELVTLIDQKPFEYASQYGVDPLAFSGDAEVNLKVTRPLRVYFTPDQIKYTISGSGSNVAAPFGVGQYQVANGEMTLYADQKGLVVKGPANIGPWRPEISWREIFDNGTTPTRYSLSGVLGRDELDDFGVGLRQYFGGEVDLQIDAHANGLEITGADVTANFVNSEMRIGPYWSKVKGIEGQLTGQLSREQSGRVRLSDIVMTSPGLELEGYFDIAGDLRLLDLDFKKAKIESFVDAALQVKPGPNGDRFDLFLTGDYLDVSPFVSNMMKAQTSTFDVPLLLTASLRRLALNETYSLRDSNILFAHDGVGIRQARLKGETLEGPLIAEVTTDDNLGIRTMQIDVPSTSEAAYAFFGLSSLVGGRLKINGTLPATGELGPMSGQAVVDNLTVMNVPAMTRLLSFASLQGLADAMNGEGLKFQSLVVPFSLESQVLSIREARAAGPALGMTANGEISFADRVLDLDGVLVPAYTANSMLGSVPVIGDIFVGKKGEGIFALSYTMRGAFAKSQVAVNPFSALTPGFLRGIFRPDRKALPPSVLEQIENARPLAPTAQEMREIELENSELPPRP